MLSHVHTTTVTSSQCRFIYRGQVALYSGAGSLDSIQGSPVARRDGVCWGKPAVSGAARLQRSVASAAVAVEPVQLAAIAAEPVAEVAVLAAVGAVCAQQGLLPLQGRRLLSGLVMNVFTPALLFSKLGASVDVPEALRLWPLAANMFACHAAGLGLGWLQVKALSPPVSLTPQITVMTALGNIGNLPLVLIPALISRPGVLELISSSSTGTAGTAANVAVFDVAAANQLGLEYVMLGFFYASFIQFPLGYLLLQRKPGQQQQQQQQAVLAPQALMTAVSGVHSSAPSTSAAADSAVGVSPTAGGSASASSSAMTMAQQQQPGLQAQASATQQPQPPLLPQQQPQVEVLLRGVFTPPVVACLLAVPVASFPELRSALFDRGGDLRFVGDVVGLLGAPLIPCLFLVLGANLAEGPGLAQVPAKVLAGLISSKLVLHPLIGLASLLAALHAGLLPADTDPLMLLVMLLVWCPPTAVLTHSLATMLQNGEDQVSYFLFWQYLASLVTLPAFLALYLQLLQSGLLTVVAAS